MNGWVQLAIACTGVAAIFLSQSANAERRRVACLFGLAGQPFWFAAAWQAEQWGILLLCVLYALAWAKGVWTHWIQPRRDQVLDWRTGRPISDLELARELSEPTAGQKPENAVATIFTAHGRVTVYGPAAAVESHVATVGRYAIGPAPRPGDGQQWISNKHGLVLAIGPKAAVDDLIGFVQRNRGR